MSNNTNRNGPRTAAVRPGAARAHGKRDHKPKTAAARPPSPAADGLKTRDAAVSALFSVLIEHKPFDDVFARASATRDLAPRDRAFARLIATSALRNRGALQAVLRTYIAKPLPEHIGRLDEILLAAAAQLLLLQTPPHAAISLAVDQCHADTNGKRFANLVNAVLRRLSESGPGRLASLDNVALTFPEWLLARWSAAYGPAEARQIARASLVEPALDITVKSDPEMWAERIGAVVLPTGSIRCAQAGRVEELPGYDEGAWWVQDAAAALPVKLFGDVAGLSVLDLCAAPGGKTAQLAALGANVTAVDKSAGRLSRLGENLARLGLSANTVVGDALTFTSETKFDAILLDSPCTSTGTIRRHPDILYLKRPEDVPALAALQAKLIDHAAGLLKPGGMLVYCTCSLEPEEGEKQIDAFLARHADFARRPITLDEATIPLSWRTSAGDLRTLPSHFADMPEGLRGLDGFFAASLVKSP
ncbi:RsmB/NOP family class I SAM-dependent RNA methyltransferase [Hyphomicrobium facile]|uniref:16S rRNA (Cytosine967-C5)-methyltransferase n=1 Tax=Hyphomicrobium facile TaxID=51670 RepID=A0A1I7NTT6_9HYPH|nr:RsmB/NOP family class I SAM-dependent RNA methyltransferase [Hyphomicrobium facile]SFV38077.1 16S rRNA (cytosine967-C5)-methyltransferase [Hyphomicrobium facile]